ncbi:MAG: hypothetical protein SGCHY_001698 [Lobulomycetales sp.]
MQEFCSIPPTPLQHDGSGKSTLWLAKSCRTCSLAVLKKIPRSAAAVRECRLVKAFSGHPNIVAFIDSAPAPENTHLLLLMEHCPSGHLVDYLNTRLKSRLKEQEICYILENVCQALAVVHAANIIHRDVKAENILLSPKSKSSRSHASADSFVFKLCDFGSATETHTPPSITAMDIRILQEELEACTTPEYRAPEILDLYTCAGITEKMDIWALGQGKLSILAAKISFPPDTFPNQPFNRIIRACLRVDQSKRPGILQILDICTALMSGKVK